MPFILIEHVIQGQGDGHNAAGLGKSGSIGRADLEMSRDRKKGGSREQMLERMAAQNELHTPREEQVAKRIEGRGQLVAVVEGSRLTVAGLACLMTLPRDESGRIAQVVLQEFSYALELEVGILADLSRVGQLAFQALTFEFTQHWGQSAHAAR